MGQIAFKFVKWDVPELATLKDCKVYRLRESLNNGGKLTRDDKNWITEQVRGCCRFQKGIALMGYYFDFSDVLKRYYVKQYGHVVNITQSTKQPCVPLSTGELRILLKLNNQEHESYNRTCLLSLQR